MIRKRPMPLDARELRTIANALSVYRTTMTHAARDASQEQTHVLRQYFSTLADAAEAEQITEDKIKAEASADREQA